MKRWLLVLFVILFALGAYFIIVSKQNSPAKPAQQPTSDTVTSGSTQNPSPETDRVTTIASSLEVPWALVFLPDESILFTERPGRVRLIDKNGKLAAQPVVTLPKVKAIEEGGLLGITIHPKFSSNHYVYLYYTYSSDGSNTLNKVVRMTYINQKLTDETVILDGIPGSIYHNGGRIKFGPDTMLYIGTGDAQEPSQAQNTTTLGGKILRVTDEGKPAPGNPFGNDVYSYGHRNVQGLAWDEQGRLWTTEHGRSGAATGFDELNLIEKGKNYGWPEIQGDEKRAGMVTPVINSGPTTTWAPSGMAYLHGSMFFAGLKGQTLYEAVLQGSSANLKTHLVREFGRLREVVVAPDGMLYVTTSNRDGRGDPGAQDDKILKINPAKLQ